MVGHINSVVLAGLLDKKLLVCMVVNI